MLVLKSDVRHVLFLGKYKTRDAMKPKIGMVKKKEKRAQAKENVPSAFLCFLYFLLVDIEDFVKLYLSINVWWMLIISAIIIVVLSLFIMSDKSFSFSTLTVLYKIL